MFILIIIYTFIHINSKCVCHNLIQTGINKNQFGLQIILIHLLHFLNSQGMKLKIRNTQSSNMHLTPMVEVQHLQLDLLPVVCPDSDPANSSEIQRHSRKTRESADKHTRAQIAFQSHRDIHLTLRNYWRLLTSLKSVPPSKQFFHVSPTLHIQIKIAVDENL